MSLDKDDFFMKMESEGLALTFDDVRLDSDGTSVAVADVDTTTKFSRNIELKTPIISAAMDTVTTSRMAIAMAKLGGLGVLHAGLSPEEQGKEARKVKHALNGLIEEPICISDSETIGEVLSKCDRKDWDFRTFPVIDDDRRFVGLLTQNDFDFNVGDLDALVSDVMTPADEVTVAGKATDVHEAFGIMKETKKKTLPLLSKKGKVKGMYVLSDVIRQVTGNPDNYSLDDNGRLLVAAAVPTDESAIERIEAMGDYLDVAVMDSAQGDSDFAFNALKMIKDQFSDLEVVVGNIAGEKGSKKIVDGGADGLKAGKGPGAICTTRTETGIGTPQVTAVYNAAKAIRGSGVPICADGGITSPGDIPIALAAGADTVMIGSKLAGTKESPGDVIMDEDGNLVKMYRGMGSPSAMQDSAASRKRYDAQGSEPLSEGVESYVPYKGSVDKIIAHYKKALVKSMSYVDAKDIDDMHEKARFYRITNAGYRESQPHDVSVIATPKRRPNL